ncbi:uncharacterized protein STEHIDRAFT_32342, partial [Stereum hirsutum FP-91666 SS1]|uniref:uncharacterized protein n=1 Tax=Stereum hirsutum (strain FP-91666) TaxID=721885 RepID=UPI000440CBF4
DGHGSHVTGEMRLLANEHNILLFCLPPHTTHKLQPLDVGVFGGVQTSWLARCAKVLAESGEEMPRADIVKEYLDVRERCFDPETVRKAFRKCGIYPFN